MTAPTAAMLRALEELLESASFWEEQAIKAEKVGRQYEAKDYRIRSQTYFRRAIAVEEKHHVTA